MTNPGWQRTSSHRGCDKFTKLKALLGQHYTCAECRYRKLPEPCALKGLVDTLCRELRKIPSAEFFEALLHFSFSYLFEKCAAYPYTTGHL
ncbi:MAG: hypothetical protein ACREV3_05655, partial [Gammaproteobacteria bacterium]